MDFSTKLPWMDKGFDAIWVIVDCLTQSTHILAIQKILCMILLLSMVFQFQLYLIEMFCSLLNFGIGSKRNQVRGCTFARHVIRRLMVRASRLSIHLRICCETDGFGTPSFFQISFLTTKTITPVSVPHHLSYYIRGSLIPQSVGERSVTQSWERPRQFF